jgi:hypothetical protein
VSDLEPDGRIERAVEVAIRFGGIDGSHHKAWVIDQMLRHLLGDEYDARIKASLHGEDGPNTYEHDVGVPP